MATKKKHPRMLLNQNQQKLQVTLFLLVLMVGTIIGLLIFLRPTFSDREKRTLTPFPSITLEGVLDGDYFSEITTWYADTYPMRDTWLDINNAVHSTYGIQTMTVQNIDNNQTKDEIPDIPGDYSTPSHNESDPQGGYESEGEESSDESDESRGEEESQGGEESNGSGEEESSSSNSSSEHHNAPEYGGYAPEPESNGTAEELEDRITAGIFVNGDAAYSRYYFVLDNAKAYVEMVNELADRLYGKTDVYSILIPESTQIVLDDQLIEMLGGSDERQAINYYYSCMSNKVHKIETFDTLKDHSGEYIYFRTDHHWTALGAYYIYQNLCYEKNRTPLSLDDYTYHNFGDFLGSFYETTGASAMASNPDYVEAWEPMGTNEEIFWEEDGNKVDWFVIADVEDWDIGSKYNAFVGGDNPFTQIVNPDLDDGSSCVIVKESFGNALAPFLVDMYEYVYIIDYRYYSGSILDFVLDYEIDDLILANDLMLASTDYVVERLGQKFS